MVRRNQTTRKRRIFPPIDWRGARRGAVAGLWVLGILAAVVAWATGVPRLQVYASTAAADARATPQVRFTRIPAWFRELEQQTLLTAVQQIGENPLTRDDLVAARDALRETGWFQDIVQVRRIDPQVIEVEARFVEPYAAIQTGSRNHLIDPDGTLLPWSYPADVQSRLVVIRGVHFPPPGRAGGTWEGVDVAAALRLLSMIEPRPWCSQVTAIDVSMYMREQVLRLVTDRGSVILWGRAPGEDDAAEIPAAGKLRRLDRFHDETGRIDRNVAGELDISRGEGVFVTG
jgi:hypothetical protein